jgi:uncharacterized protein YgiM (DUF1202 family)
MTRGKIGVVAAAALAWCACGVLAESVWVKSDSVDLRSGKGAAYGVVASAKKGTELTVVSRDGKWVQVQAAAGAGGAATTGWIYESALSPQKVNGDFFAGMNQGAAGLNTANAARGLEPETETYASNKHMSKAPLEHLISIKAGIQGAEWEAFNKDVQAGVK